MELMNIKGALMSRDFGFLMSVWFYLKRILELVHMGGVSELKFLFTRGLGFLTHYSLRHRLRFTAFMT